MSTAASPSSKVVVSFDKTPPETPSKTPSKTTPARLPESPTPNPSLQSSPESESSHKSSLRRNLFPWLYRARSKKEPTVISSPTRTRKSTNRLGLVLDLQKQKEGDGEEEGEGEEEDGEEKGKVERKKHQSWMVTQPGEGFDKADLEARERFLGES